MKATSFVEHIYREVMSNIIIYGDGEIIGFPTQFGIGRDSEGVVIVGALQTEGRSLGELFGSREFDIETLSSNVTVVPKENRDFEAKFVYSANNSILAIDSVGMAISILASQESRQLFFALNTEALKGGNKFESYVADISSWLGVKTVVLAIQNRGSFDTMLISKLSPSFANISIPKSHRGYQMLAYTTFDLSTSEFGCSIQKLTTLSTLHFAAGASLNDGDFGVSLLGDRVETESMIYENFGLELQRADGNISCRVGGSFTLKLDKRNFGFKLYGVISTKSVLFTAYSDDNSRIEINSRLALSSLALSIGVGTTGVTFAMTGATMVGNLYIFAGIAIIPTPPYISLISSAITSTKGRVSLKDLVVEIADITTSAVDCLDVVAVSDFEMNNIQLTDTIKNMPCEDDLDYSDKKSSVAVQTKDDFNQRCDSSLSIGGDVELTRIGYDGSNQYIMTDKAKMRHYRIDHTGRVSLSCQLYVCNSPTVVGDNTMDIGMFMCGVIEIFGTKTKFLFLIDKGNSLVAFVQLPNIDIFGAIVISKSKRELGVDKSVSNNSINDTFVGELSGANDSNEEGATLYLNIQRDKGDVTLFVSASVNILHIFIYDALIVIKDRKVYINIEQSVIGFKTIFFVESDLSGFGTASFAARVTFNTDGFSDALKKAQASLRSAADTIQKKVNDANNKIADTKKKILSLRNQIDNYNGKINGCRSSLRGCKWYHVARKVSLYAQIACYEVSKGGIYVAIGVADGVLSIAQAAVTLGGTIASTTLKSISYLLSAVTQVLWIKSFELGIDISKSKRAISSSLALTIFGKDVNISGSIDISAITGGIESLLNEVKDRVSHSLQERTSTLINDIKSGKVSRSAIDDAIIEAEYKLIEDEHIGIEESLSSYNDLVAMRDVVEDFYVDMSDLYFDSYNEEDFESTITAAKLTEMRWEEEQNSVQSRDILDEDFISTLEDVVAQIDQAEGVTRSVEQSFRHAMVASIKNMASQRETIQRNTTQRESLLSRMDYNNELKRTTRRSRAENSEISAEQANESYIRGLYSLMNKHFGNTAEGQPQDDVTSEFVRSVAVAIQQFQNNDDTTFRKR